MSYVWEQEYNHEPRRIGPQRFSVIDWHLKKLLPSSGLARDVTFMISVAWVRRISDRKYLVTINQHGNDDKTFRSLKAAKAYALAIVTLEQ